MIDDDNTILTEVTPLSEADYFYIVDRRKKEFTYPMHCHREYELNFILHAPGVKRIVGDSEEVIGDMDLVLITGGQLEHVWLQHECTSEDIREITLQFAPDIFPDNWMKKNQFLSIRQMFERARCGLSFPLEAILKVYATLDNLATKKIGFYSVIRLWELLYQLSLFDKAKVLSSSSYARTESFSTDSRIQKIQRYINDNYSQVIKLATLAGIVGMTPESFSRFFHLSTGKTVSDYILDVRIGAAMRRIVDSDDFISEICYNCGFNNISNFNRLFKKKKGCSPKEFRENYKKRKVII